MRYAHLAMSSQSGQVPGGTDERLFTPAFIALTLAELAYFSADGLLIPVTPLYAAGQLGAGEIGVGVTVGAFSATALVLRPFAGRAADRRGRRPLLIGGAALCAVALLGHLLAVNLAILIGLRLVLGVAEAFFFVAGFAALADLAPPGRTGEALSYNSLALYLGIALGPLVGQALLDLGGFDAAWLGAVGFALVAVVLAWRLPETAPEFRVSEAPAPLIHRGAIAPGLGLFSGIAVMTGFFAFVALYAEDIGFTRWSLVLMEFGLVVVATRVLFARLPDRVPPFRLGAIALVLTAAGVLIVAAIPNAYGLFGGAAVMAVGVAFTTPAFFGAIVSRAEPTQRGAAMGTASAFIDLALGGGPVLFGVVAAVGGGIPAAFVAGSVLASLGALWTLSLTFPTRSVPTGET